MARSGATWFTAATTAVVRHLPFGLSRIIAPSLLGFAVINSCTFALDLGLLTVFHGVLRWPDPVSITLSYGTATCLSYVLNRTLNFHSHGLVGRQVAIYAVVVAINYLALILGVGSGLAALGLEYQLARLVAGACEAIYMYLAMRFVVFRDTSWLGQILDDHVHGAVTGVGLYRPPDIGGDLRHRDAVAPDDVHLQVVVADNDTGHPAAGQIGADAPETAAGQGRHPGRGADRGRDIFGCFAGLRWRR
jgi:putative flippase GtrA